MKTGIMVKCTTCHRQKKPRGRSAPIGLYMCEPIDLLALNCNRPFDGCLGYNQEPKVGWLWPGETEEDFGYPCPDDGTKEA